MGLVSRVRGFVNASFNLVADDFTDFLFEARRDRSVVLNPGNVRDCRYANWGKEVGPKTTSFRIFPSESSVLLSNEIDENVKLSLGEETGIVFLNEGCFAFVVKTRCQYKKRGVGIETGYCRKGIAKNVSFYSEVFANLASDGFCLHSDRLILLFDLDSFAFWLGV